MVNSTLSNLPTVTSASGSDLLYVVAGNNSRAIAFSSLWGAIPIATTTDPGLLSAADKTKLDAVSTTFTGLSDVGIGALDAEDAGKFIGINPEGNTVVLLTPADLGEIPADIESIDGFLVTRSALDSSYNGQPLVWDQAQNAFIVPPPGFDTLRLGGGDELILSHDVSVDGTHNSWITEASHNIDQYDEIKIVWLGGNSKLTIGVSSDGGSTEANVWNSRYSGVGSSGQNVSLTPLVYAGSNDNNQANTYAIASIQHHALDNAPTIFSTDGGEVGDHDDQLHWVGSTTTATRHNAIYISSGAATVGLLYVIGIKKSRQPLEVYGSKTGGSIGASEVIAVRDTIGMKFRAGVQGKIRVSPSANADATFTVLNGSGVQIGSGTVSGGATTADITFPATVTVTDFIQMVAPGTPDSSITDVHMVVRGETA